MPESKGKKTKDKIAIPVKHLDLWSAKFPIFKVAKDDFHKHFFLKRFLEIPDAPKEIYFRGKFPTDKHHYLAVVGSRNISPYGKNANKKIISGIMGQNICIISGLALGTDGEALNAGLTNNLHTIAIPGSGLSEKLIAPRTNKKIAEAILKSGGLLLSEFPPDYYTGVWSFPQRNRIMAALSDAVLLIEAAPKSGTLITARLALEYNKDVLCVPGEIFSENSKGTNKLISEGAKVIRDGNDILDQFRISYNEENTSKEISFAEIKGLSDTEKSVIKNLNSPIPKEKLAENTGLPINQLLITLTMLEMKGFIKEEAGLLRRIR